MDIPMTVSANAVTLPSTIESGAVFPYTRSTVVTGYFYTGTTGGVERQYTTGYRGNGFPIAVAVYVRNGIYNDGSGGDLSWYLLVQRYAIGAFYATKSQANVAPTYKTSGAENYGAYTVIYKNSVTTYGLYTATGGVSMNLYSPATAHAAANPAGVFRFIGDGKTFSYYVASSSYGLAARTYYSFSIVYSS